MKVLFVSSGKNGTVGDVVLNQGESLKTAGVNVDYCLIKPGFYGYLSAIPRIRKTFRQGSYEVAHAHYSLSGFAAALAGCKPLVVSLMGSDAFMSKWLRVVARFFYSYKWDATIVKTIQMKEVLYMTKAHIIPNGVDLDRFKPMPKADARKYLNYPERKNLIVSISNPNRFEKNRELADKAIEALKYYEVDFKHIYNVPNSEIPYYLNAADLLLLTSKWEGSVNVVKEAMACNCPVVSTYVGDVRFVTGNTEGCYITSFVPEDVTKKIKTALAFCSRTNGRQRIIELGLDSETTAKKIVEVYKEVISSL